MLSVLDNGSIDDGMLLVFGVGSVRGHGPMRGRALMTLILTFLWGGYSNEAPTDCGSLRLEVEKRPLLGAATEAVQGAREGLWKMRNEPGVAYLCGPMALKSLATMEPKQNGAVSLLDAARSGPNGFSLEQVADLSQQAGLPY